VTQSAWKKEAGAEEFGNWEDVRIARGVDGQDAGFETFR
jgi:hypothetical protein